MNLIIILSLALCGCFRHEVKQKADWSGVGKVADECGNVGFTLMGCGRVK